MENLEGKWCFGQDSEDFRGEFNSKEEAIKAGKEEVEELLTVGTMYKPTLSVSADCVIEQIQIDMYEEYGECAEQYLDNVTSEQREELEKELNKVLDAWIEKNNLQSDFYGVKEIKYVEE